MGINETPSLINGASEPVTEGIDEQVNSVVGLIVDKKQFALDQQHLPQDIRNPGAEFKGEGHGGVEIVFFELFDHKNIEKVGIGLRGNDMCDPLPLELVRVGSEVRLIVTVVNVVHYFHQVPA